MPSRTFLALPLEPDVRARLGQAQRQLNLPGAKIKWMAPENLHLTVRFLGELDDARLAEACRAAQQAAADCDGFDFDVAGISAQPAQGPLRMFWAGVIEPAGRLMALREAVDEALGPIGKPDHRPFRPHVTLGRVKKPGDREALRAAAAERAAEPFGPNEAAELHVMTSILTPGGPVYTPAARCAIGM